MGTDVRLPIAIMAIAILVGSVGCPKAIPNPQDTSPPNVAIVYRFPSASLVYVDAGPTQSWGQGFQLDVICRYTDEQGLKTTFGDVGVSAKFCDSPLGCTQCNCSFADPASPESTTLTPDAQGKFPTWMAYARTITREPQPHCSSDSTKAVLSAVYTVTCSATNFGGQQTDKSVAFNMGNPTGCN